VGGLSLGGRYLPPHELIGGSAENVLRCPATRSPTDTGSAGRQRSSPDGDVCRNVYNVLYTLHCIHYLVYSTLYTVHYTPYTFTWHLYSTLCTGHLNMTTSTWHFYTIHIYRTLLQTQNIYTQDISTHDIEIISSTHIFKGQSGNAEQILTCDIEQGLPCRTLDSLLMNNT
jgi:hypothetical protein